MFGDGNGPLSLFGLGDGPVLLFRRWRRSRVAVLAVAQVFVKQQLDIMTARQWLTGDKALKEQIVQLSVASGVPCAHTSMVGFNVKKADMAKMAAQRKNGNMKVRCMPRAGP